MKNNEGQEFNNNSDVLISKEVSIITRDGLNLSIEYYVPKSNEKLPAVLLLHMLGKDKSSWAEFINLLLSHNYIVYTVDLRGHGRNVRMQDGKEIFYQNMNEADWQKIPDDVLDVISFISQDKFVDSSKIALIGASIGANASILVAEEHPEKIKSIAAISPGINYKGLNILDSSAALKSPVLIAVSEEDSYSYSSSNQLNNVVKAAHNLLIYKGDKHGNDLLTQEKDLQDKIVSWLDEYFKF